MILMTSFDHLRMLNQSIAAVYSNRWSTGTNLLQLKHRIGLATSVNDTCVAMAIGVNMASDGQPVLPA